MKATLWRWLAAGFFLALAPSAKGDSCDSDLGKWLDCNNPRIITYLSSLKPSQIGTVLDGVVLTDGSNPLKGLTLIGLPKVENGAHIYVLSESEKRSAYVWVEQGGSELEAPRCRPQSVLGNAFVLSGDIYTWNAVQPGHGVVRLECVDERWLTSAKPAAPSQK